MKLQWSPQELIDHWTLNAEELTLVENISQTEYNRLGYALLLKYFQREGKFPQRKQDIPTVIVEYIIQQLRIQASALDFYNWKGRTTKRHRVQVRQFLGVRTGTVADAMNIGAWLAAHILLQEERQFDRLKGIVYELYKELKIEPPEPKSIDRLIRSAVRNADEQFYATTMEKLSSATREKLDGFLTVTNSFDGTTTNVSVLYDLKSEAGVVGLESVLNEIAKLRHIRSLELPPNLFSKTSRKALSWVHQRIAVEDLHEVRRHPTEIRYTLLAAYCWQREQEITDTLIELLISLIHRIGTRAERTVDKQLLKEIKRV